MVDSVLDDEFAADVFIPVPIGMPFGRYGILLRGLAPEQDGTVAGSLLEAQQFLLCLRLRAEGAQENCRGGGPVIQWFHPGKNN